MVSCAVIMECVTGVRMVAMICVVSGGVGVMASLLLMFEGKDVEAESSEIGVT